MIGAQERHAEPSHEASQARSRLATHPAVLWQFRNSHFNEKVRWALDWKRVPHLRRSLVPGLHIGRALWMTGKKQVPVLSVDGQVTADSTAIIAVLERLVPDPPLYPADPVDRRRALELEDFFDEELGPHLRRALFHAVLPDADFASAFLTVGTGAVTQRLYRLCFPLVRAVMRADMRIDDAGAALGVRKIGAALDHIRAELRPSGYLVGEGFTVADLTAAALLYPLVLPPEAPYRLDRPIPPAAAEMRGSFAAHPAFTWAAGMYRRHRGTSAEVAGR